MYGAKQTTALRWNNRQGIASLDDTFWKHDHVSRRISFLFPAQVPKVCIEQHIKTGNWTDLAGITWLGFHFSSFRNLEIIVLISVSALFGKGQLSASVMACLCVLIHCTALATSLILSTCASGMEGGNASPMEVGYKLRDKSNSFISLSLFALATVLLSTWLRSSTSIQRSLSIEFHPEEIL